MSVNHVFICGSLKTFVAVIEMNFLSTDTFNTMDKDDSGTIELNIVEVRSFFIRHWMTDIISAELLWFGCFLQLSSSCSLTKTWWCNCDSPAVAERVSALKNQNHPEPEPDHCGAAAEYSTSGVFSLVDIILYNSVRDLLEIQRGGDISSSCSDWSSRLFCFWV